MNIISNDLFANRRPSCNSCLRPLSTCICSLVTHVAHACDVLILQHPLEVHNAKNSARLLHLCLPHSKIVSGETFDESELHNLLHAPSTLPGVSAKASKAIQPVLLYPMDASDPDAQPFAAQDLHAAQSEEDGPMPLRLVILDGTWRKSRKMIYENALLRTLPRLSLRNTPVSQYLIRKSHKPEQLSTLEAGCYALMQLEKDSAKYHPLLNAFDDFVLQQSLLQRRVAGA
jgi:DTW domain-containing protein YfiP